MKLVRFNAEAPDIRGMLDMNGELEEFLRQEHPDAQAV